MYLNYDAGIVSNSVQSIEIDLDDDLGFSSESESDSDRPSDNVYYWKK